MSLTRAVLALAAAGTLAAAGASAQTSLTIYNDGRVLVRRTVPVAVPNRRSTRNLPHGPHHTTPKN